MSKNAQNFCCFFKIFLFKALYDLNLGTGLSIDNILRLDSFDAKINSKHAVKKVLELAEK